MDTFFIVVTVFGTAVMSVSFLLRWLIRKDEAAWIKRVEAGGPLKPLPDTGAIRAWHISGWIGTLLLAFVLHELDIDGRRETGTMHSSQIPGPAKIPGPAGQKEPDPPVRPQPIVNKPDEPLRPSPFGNTRPGSTSK